MLRFILGTLALLATAVFAFVIEGGDPIALILPSPLIIVVCVPAFSVLAVWHLKTWGQALKDAFAKEKPSSSAGASARLWDFLEKAFYIAGVIGFLLGLNIIFMTQSRRPQEFDLFRGLAVDCIAPILAILFAMVARILKARVENRR